MMEYRKPTPVVHNKEPHYYLIWARTHTRLFIRKGQLSWAPRYRFERGDHTKIRGPDGD